MATELSEMTGRISEGYDLLEVQQALTLLEERAWRLAVDGSNLESIIEPEESSAPGLVGRREPARAGDRA